MTPFQSAWSRLAQSAHVSFGRMDEYLSAETVVSTGKQYISGTKLFQFMYSRVFDVQKILREAGTNGTEDQYMLIGSILADIVLCVMVVGEAFGINVAAQLELKLAALRQQQAHQRSGR